MISLLRQVALSYAVAPILRGVRSKNTHDAQRVLARYIKARCELIDAEFGQRKHEVGRTAARAHLVRLVQNLGAPRRFREARSASVGAPDAAASMLQEYFVGILLAGDDELRNTFDALLQGWYADLGGIETTFDDRTRAESAIAFNFQWLAQSVTAITQQVRSTRIPASG